MVGTPTTSGENEVNLFGSGGLPVLVRDQTAQVPSGPLRVAAVKVVFVLSGWGRLHTPTGEELLGAGSILTIPNGIGLFAAEGVDAERGVGASVPG